MVNPEEQRELLESGRFFLDEQGVLRRMEGTAVDLEIQGAERAEDGWKGGTLIMRWPPAPKLPGEGRNAEAYVWRQLYPHLSRGWVSRDDMPGLQWLDDYAQRQHWPEGLRRPILLWWWYSGWVKLRGPRRRIGSNRRYVIHCAPRGRYPPLWRLDYEGLTHLSSLAIGDPAAIHYDIEATIDDDLAALIRQREREGGRGRRSKQHLVRPWFDKLPDDDCGDNIADASRRVRQLAPDLPMSDRTLREHLRDLYAEKRRNAVGNNS